MQKLFSWMESHLFLLLFPLPKETYPKKYHEWYQRMYLPLFSSRSFMVSGLTFKSLIHFQVYFCIRSEKVVHFNTLACSCFQFSQHCLLKEAVFSPILYSCLLCHKLINHIHVGLFLGREVSLNAWFVYQFSEKYVGFFFFFLNILQRWLLFCFL